MLLVPFIRQYAVRLKLSYSTVMYISLNFDLSSTSHSDSEGKSYFSLKSFDENNVISRTFFSLSVTMFQMALRWLSKWWFRHNLILNNSAVIR